MITKKMKIERDYNTLLDSANKLNNQLFTIFEDCLTTLNNECKNLDETIIHLITELQFNSMRDRDTVLSIIAQINGFVTAQYYNDKVVLKDNAMLEEIMQHVTEYVNNYQIINAKIHNLSVAK